MRGRGAHTALPEYGWSCASLPHSRFPRSRPAKNTLSFFFCYQSQIQICAGRRHRTTLYDPQARPPTGWCTCRDVRVSSATLLGKLESAPRHSPCLLVGEWPDKADPHLAVVVGLHSNKVACPIITSGRAR
jgi:hypothetical protein